MDEAPQTKSSASESKPAKSKPTRYLVRETKAVSLVQGIIRFDQNSIIEDPQLIAQAKRYNVPLIPLE